MRPALVAVLVAAACGDDAAPAADAGPLVFERLYTSQAFAGCPFAGPLAIESQGDAFVLAQAGDGTLAALDPEDGATAFTVTLPAPAGEASNVAAPPALLPGRLVVAWQNVLPDFTRTRHLVAVVDLDARALDPAFPTVELAASLPSWDGAAMIDFSPANAYSRSAIAHLPATGGSGTVYVTYGNIQDIQPWHGWVFELDLDAWQAGGEPVSAVLVTTPESDCGPPGMSGSTDMICGGGVWAPAGAQVFGDGQGGYDLVVPTGNGQLDLAHGDYANTLMRTGAGLAFDPGCDPVACAGFDPIDPAPACTESCANLFIPRLLPGDPFPDPPGDLCAGMTFMECYARLDWDLGANAPVLVDRFLLLPAKDGAVYLIDWAHLGTLHDREIVAPVCGSGGGACSANWAGMMVTMPAVTQLEGVPVAVIPTFEHDTNNPAGLVALRVLDDPPRLEPHWQVPARDAPEAITRFRRHTGRPFIARWGTIDYALVVDVGRAGGEAGYLWVVRVADGALAARVELDGPGQRYALPLVLGDTVYLSSCDSNDGPGWIEAYRLAATAP